MATLQTGTAPNQIPTNGDLGDLAFQSKESVQFTGGRGALSSINLNQIYKEIAVTAVDVFVYDTSRDSDGGAWRRRTQHTSWYNETLNTATRGSRREFPSVAVIVCTTNTMTVYDGDDPTLPMWMVFSPNGLIDWPTTTHTRLIAGALNGGIVVVSEDGGLWFRFIDDTTHIIYSTLTYNVTSDKSIANRNGTTSYNASGAALNTYATVGYVYNDVAMTVLPNAPIDTATGLPTPTIAIAGTSGLSVIQNTGGVATYVPSGSQIQKVAWGSDGSLWVTTPHISGVVGYRLYYYKAYTVATGALSSPTSVYGYLTGIALNVSGGEAPGGGGYFDSVKVTSPNEVSFASIGATTQGQCLTKLSYNPANPSSSLVAFVKSKYNTGWMPGDIKGAWLSDNTAETVVGEKLSSNTFYNTGWTTSGAGDFVINANGTVTVTGTGNKTESYLQSPTFTTTVGKTYVISVRTSSASGTGIGIYAYGTGGPNAYVWDRDFVFVSTASSTNFFLYRFGGHTGSATITSISVKEADLDRSVNKNPLQVFGSITKTPVATGADLVAYSGFSSSNYLMQPYNSALDFGTGDFSAMGWVRLESNSAGTIIFFDRSDTNWPTTGYGSRLFFGLNGGTNSLYYYTDNGSLYTNVAIPLNTWLHCCLIRNGTLHRIYMNGQLVLTNTHTASNLSNSANVLTVGNGTPSKANQMPGSLALWRISATAPSAEQIAKIYEDEKYLFQENAKATLYGTSDSVIALAYDEDTRLLHVGTSSGRSVFSGLRRVDNTTTAVGAAISAANGLVAED